MSSLNTFNDIGRFELALAEYTGAPYAVMTDCCTHAIELCLRYDKITDCTFTPYTYLSIPMTMHKLGIDYNYFPDHLPHRQQWIGEYKFEGTRIWDSARFFEPGMYRAGQIQCLSFGRTKPLEIGIGGCLLTDNTELYQSASRMRSDGRDLLTYSPWAEQVDFELGFHYFMKPEHCVAGLNLLKSGQLLKQPEFYNYPDCRTLNISAPRKIKFN
jgi:dTDP-4-amino-4,6-dideoxygalactose transaminase